MSLPRNPRPETPEIALGKTQARGVAEVSLGRQEDPLERDWRAHYLTFKDLDEAPPLTFLIQDFIHAESITGLAAPVAQRKSLIALNIAHSLITGESLFGRFPVIEKPARVLYICPEMGTRSFAKRVREIGLLPYVGKTLFCRTMNMTDRLGLDDLTREELDGAVVILDTAIRFMEGDENSSEDMRRLAESLFRLIPKENTPGALCVLVLYHSPKGTKESNELTLENVLRGSGELGAALTNCWATRLQDPDKPHESRSFIANVKPRDFDDTPKPFEVEGKGCRLYYIENDGDVVLKIRSKGNVANKDGMDDAALAFIKANPELSGSKLASRLQEHGIKRSPDWVNKKKAQLRGSGCTVSAG